MNSLLGEKEEMEEEKKIIVLRIVSLLLQSITQSAQERKGTAHHLVPLYL